MVVSRLKELREATIDMENVHRRLRIVDRLINVMPHGVIIYDLVDNNDPHSFVIAIANPACSVLAGFDLSDAIGKKLIDVFPGVLESKFCEQLFQVLETGQSHTYRDYMYKEKEDKVFHFTAFHLGNGSVGVVFSLASEGE